MSKSNVVKLADVMGTQAEAERVRVEAGNTKEAPIRKEKMPLVREKKKAKPFPLDALLSLQPTVEAMTNISQAPDVLVVQGVLSAVNYAVQAHANVDAGFGSKPISEYWILSARSGERKSGVDSMAWRAVQDYQDALILAMGDDCQTPDDDGKVKISPIILVTEPTSEGLVQHLERSIGSVALATDEGGAFIGGYAMSKDQALKTMSKLSSIWDGKPITSMRAGSTKSRHATHKRMNMSIMGQPSVIAMLLGSQIAKNQGFLSRCLLAEPESTIGTRKFRRASDADRKVVEEFNAAMRKILERRLPLIKGSVNKLDPKVIKLSKQAKLVLATFADEVEVACAKGGRLAQISDFASKAAEHVMRISGTFAMWDNFETTRIDSIHVTAGTSVVGWYIEEALRLTGADFDVDLDLAQNVLEWIQQRKRIHEEFSLVEIYQRSISAVRHAKKARQMMKILADHGWVESVEGTVEFDGLPRREVYRLI
jgi:hypothetical protein